MITVRIITALVSLIYMIISVNGLDVTPIPHVLEKLSDFYRDRVVFSSPGLIYGTCDQTDSASSERRCSLALETDSSLKNYDEHLRLCNVTLEASAGRGKIGRDFHFYALEHEKALLQWINEDARDRYAIVDFSNCTVIYAKFDDLDIQSSYVVGANNNSIDIIVRNSKGSRCQSIICKLTLDFKGNVVEDMREWLKIPYDLIALVISPSKGRLAVDYTGSLNRTLRVYTVDDHGETNVIKEFPATDDRLKNAIEVSTTYQMLTVCYALEANVTCAQFDNNGTFKFEKTLSPTDRLHSIKVHNLPAGGFVVLTTDCSTRETKECIADYRSSYTWYLDPDGEFVGYIGIGWYECAGGGFVMNTEHFFVNEKQELCFSDLCPKVRIDKQLMLQVVCLAREDFY